MDKFGKTEQARGTAKRPSLYLEQQQGAAEKEEAFSILDSIEPVRRRRLAGHGLVRVTLCVGSIAIGAALLLGGADGVMRWVSTEEPAVREPVALAPVPDATPPVEHVAEAVAPSNGEDEWENRVPDSSDEARNADLAQTPPPEEVVLRGKSEPALEEPLAAVPVLPLATSDAAEMPVAQKKPASGAGGKTARTARKQERKAASKAKNKTAVAKARPAPKESKQPGKDQDVELIAALLSHVSRPDAGGKPGQQKSAKPANGPESATASGKEKAQDTAARMDNASTAAQLKRCQSLGTVEAQSCRERVCAGKWGKDPACPNAAAASQ